MARSDVDLRDDEYRDEEVRRGDYRSGDYRGAPSARESRPYRRSPETKTFLASSEFWVTVGAIVAVFIGGYLLNDITNSTAWKYGTWIAIAYIVSRGIAKAGSQRLWDPVPEARPMRDSDSTRA